MDAWYLSSGPEQGTDDTYTSASTGWGLIGPTAIDHLSFKSALFRLVVVIGLGVILRNRIGIVG